MTDPDRMGRRLKRKMATRSAAGYWVYLGAALLIASFWSMYAMDRFLHFDLVKWLKPSSGDPYERPFDATPVYLFLAIAVTVIAPIWAKVKSENTRQLLKDGVETTGTVVSKSLLQSHGMVPTTFAYTVDGREYRFRKDVLNNAYNVGDQVRIIYDKANPRRRFLL